MTAGVVGVLIVEDSPVQQTLLVHILQSDPKLEVIGVVESGEEALEFIARRRPGLVLMDVHLPEMDGFEATRRIMESYPVPIVVASAISTTAEVTMAFRAVEAGALAFVEKPIGPAHPRYKEIIQKLIETVKLMAEVKVVKRWTRRPAAHAVSPTPNGTEPAPKRAPIRVVAIGASTGGPPALQTILTRLPSEFPVPVLIVQHIAAGFLGGMVDWLRQVSGWPVHIGAHGQGLQPGHIYVAPEDVHLGVDRSGAIALSNDPPDNGVRPSVAHLFRTVAAAYGAGAVGVLLTGMGRDGAAELKLLRDAGATTIAQDADSSVVHGMPGEAIQLGAARHVLPPDRIAALLTNLIEAHPPA